MLLTTDTQSIDPESHLNITWIENLTIGLTYLLVHPFLPFLRSNFNYQCLFLRKSHCPVETSSPSKIINGYVYDLVQRTQEAHFKNLTSILVPEVLQPFFKSQNKVNSAAGTQSCLSPLRYIIDRRILMSPNFLLLAQLVICSVGLSYFLYRDLRVMIERICIRRRKSANKLRV